jgi:hypothetical protein
MFRKTYVDWLIPHQSRVLHHFQPSAVLQSGNLLGLVTQGEYEMMEGGGRLVGRFDDGHGFVDYLTFC